jgi:hypothetical protein
MSQVAPYRRLRDIILPGTHDSSTATFDWNEPAISTRGIAHLANYTRLPLVSLILPDILARIARTQSNTIYQQLCLGVRSLDLRVSFTPGRGFCLSHTYVCGSLSAAINSINRFMDDNPSEIILLQVSRDYENSYSFNTVIDFAELRHVCDIYDPASAVISDLVSYDKRVIISTSLDLPVHTYQNFVSSHWANTSIGTALYEKCQRHLEVKANYKELSLVMTPQIRDVVLSIFFGSNTPLHLASSAKSVLINLNSSIQTRPPNVLTLDFATDSGIMNYIQKYNTTQF